MSSDGIDPGVDVDNVVVVKGPHHLADGVGLPDGGEELVAQTFPSDAPRTNPAISTKVTWPAPPARYAYRSELSSRASGTPTTPTLGSMVAKG